MRHDKPIPVLWVSRLKLQVVRFLHEVGRRWMGETAHHVLSCPEKGSVPGVIE